MRVVFWPVVVVFAVLCSLFAISNRQVVSLGLWPLPFLVETRLYLLVFLALLIGFGIGLLAAWVAGHRRRRELRQCRRHADALQRELAAAQARLDNTIVTPQPALPAHG